MKRMFLSLIMSGALLPNSAGAQTASSAELDEAVKLYKEVYHKNDYATPDMKSKRDRLFGMIVAGTVDPRQLLQSVATNLPEPANATYHPRCSAVLTAHIRELKVLYTVEPKPTAEDAFQALYPQILKHEFLKEVGLDGKDGGQLFFRRDGHEIIWVGAWRRSRGPLLASLWSADVAKMMGYPYNPESNACDALKDLPGLEVQIQSWARR